MHTKWAGVSLALACGLTAGSGFAQQLGDDGTFAIGVDRVRYSVEKWGSRLRGVKLEPLG